MKIKLQSGGFREIRMRLLERSNWQTMSCHGTSLVLTSKDDGVTFSLETYVPKRIEAKFDYDFVKRLIENAD